MLRGYRLEVGPHQSERIQPAPAVPGRSEVLHTVQQGRQIICEIVEREQRDTSSVNAFEPSERLGLAAAVSASDNYSSDSTHQSSIDFQRIQDSQSMLVNDM